MSEAKNTKPKLKPVEGYEGLFVYEGLRRNSNSRREEIYSAIVGVVRQPTANRKDAVSAKSRG